MAQQTDIIVPDRESLNSDPLATSLLSLISPQEWLEKVLSLGDEKSLAKDFLMHSQWIAEGNISTLVYLESLNCLMTPSIEQKMRSLVHRLGCDAKNLRIVSGAIEQYPQKLCEEHRNRQKRAIQEEFYSSPVGQYLLENPPIWKNIAELTQDDRR